MEAVQSKGVCAVQKLLDECGLDSVFDISLELLIAGRGVILRYKELDGADGRIVSGFKGNAIITINSKIEYEGKRRFTIAHELGHFEMHKNLVPHNENDKTLQFFYKKGEQETEANEFATELLMPSDIFNNNCSKSNFSPDLLRNLAIFFNTSITSVAFRYLAIGKHPIFLFYSYKNKVKYWKNSNKYYLKVIDITNLHPPENSVAAEYYNDGTIYSQKESMQEITKSVWFELSKFEKDSKFYEYCIVTPKYNTVLSIVWSDS